MLFKKKDYLEEKAKLEREIRESEEKKEMYNLKKKREMEIIELKKKRDESVRGSRFNPEKVEKVKALLSSLMQKKAQESNKMGVKTRKKKQSQSNSQPYNPFGGDMFGGNMFSSPFDSKPRKKSSSPFNSDPLGLFGGAPQRKGSKASKPYDPFTQMRF